LAALLAENAASANVPGSLLVATTRAATLLAAGQAATVITLTEGVLRTMFIAKFKTATVLLCGVAVLGLGTGGLCYQTRAGAADTPQVGRKPTADEEKARKSGGSPSEDARAREKSLLEEVEKARKEALMQRNRAEAERKRAEDALLALKEQLAKAQEAEQLARQEADKARYAENVRQAQQGFRAKREEQKGLDRLAELQAKTRERFKQERQELMERMKKLEAEERETLAKMEAERGELLRQQNVRQPARPAGGQPPQGGDKLDRILERLDRIERRLERLERGGPSSGGRK
jgi:hypothetical protein